MRDDLQRPAVSGPEPKDPEVGVERARAADVQSLDQGEAGAIDDAERLVRPFLRDLATTPKILGRDAYDG